MAASPHTGPSSEGAARLADLPRSSIRAGHHRISFVFSLIIRGANLILLVVFKNLFHKQNNNPGQRSAKGPGCACGDLSFYYFQSTSSLQRTRKHNVCVCPAVLVFLYMCNREAERELIETN